MALVKYGELHSINEPIHTFYFSCNDCSIYGLQDVSEKIYGENWVSVFAEVKKKITKLGKSHTCPVANE